MKPFGYSLFASFFSKLDEYLNAVFPAMDESFGNLAFAIVLIYIVVVGFLLMKGTFNKDQTIEFAFSLVIVGAVAGFLKTGVYFDWVVYPLVGSVLDLTSFFIGVIQNETNGSGLSGLFASLDTLSFKIFDLVFTLDLPGGLSNILPLLKSSLLAIILLTVHSLGYLAFLIMIIIGFFSMYIYFTVGGICIFFAAFAKTRFIFFAWLKGIVNNALLVVFASIIMSICYFGLHQSINDLIELKGAASLFSAQYVSTVCWSALTFGLLLKAPDYAAQLSGGAAGSTTGIAAGLSMAGGAGVAALGKMASMGGHPATIKGMKAGMGAAANGANRAYSQLIGLPKKFM